MKKPLLIMLSIIVAIAVLCGVGVGVYIYVKQSTAPKVPKPLTAAQEAALQVTFPQLISNLQTDGLVQFTLTLQASDAQTKDEVSAMMPQIEDAVNMLTRSFTADNLRQDKGYLQLKQEILTAVNSKLQHGQVTAVYLGQIVVQ